MKIIENRIASNDSIADITRVIFGQQNEKSISTKTTVDIVPITTFFEEIFNSTPELKKLCYERYKKFISDIKYNPNAANDLIISINNIKSLTDDNDIIAEVINIMRKYKIMSNDAADAISIFIKSNIKNRDTKDQKQPTKPDNIKKEDSEKRNMLDTNAASTAANNIGYNPMTFNIGNFVNPVSIDTESKPVTFVPPVVPHLQTAPAPTAQDLLKIKLEHLKQHIKFLENGTHAFTMQDLNSLDVFIHSMNLKMTLDKHKAELPLMLFEIEVTPEKAKDGYDLCFRVNCTNNKHLKIFYGTKQMIGQNNVLFNPVVIEECNN